jgi:hypothetical protein
MDTRTWSIPELAGISALVILLLIGHVAATSSWNVKTINDPALDGIYPDISGDYVIYSGSIGDPMLPNSTRVIQLYSLSSGDQARIATSGKNATLAGIDIDGNYAVWFSEPNLGLFWRYPQPDIPLFHPGEEPDDYSIIIFEPGMAEGLR